MITTIRVDKSLQQQLKLMSAETGVSQLALANNYYSGWIENDKTPETCNDFRKNRKIIKT